MSLPIKPPVELNEEQREAAEELGILDFVTGKEKTELAQVFVPRHPRMREGQIEDVDAYTYERDGGGNLPTKKARGAERPLTDEEFEEKYGQPRPKDGKGDCYQAAFDVMGDAFGDGEDISTYRYCVGVPTGRGPIEGVKYDHAWVEHTTKMEAPKEMLDQWKKQGLTQRQIDGMLTITTVIDHANGNDVELPDALYYSVGHIDPDEVTRYTFEQMMAKAERYMYLGIWPEED